MSGSSRTRQWWFVNSGAVFKVALNPTVGRLAAPTTSSGSCSARNARRSQRAVHARSAIRCARRLRRCAVTATVDRWLLDTIRADRSVHALVRGAVDMIVAEDGTGPITNVASRLGVTPRQFKPRFRAATGLTPKEYAGIRRACAALKRLVVSERGGVKPGLAQLAVDSGYADQAHLTREVGRLTTFTPTMLAERFHDIAHDQLVD